MVNEDFITPIGTQNANATQSLHLTDSTNGTNLSSIQALSSEDLTELENIDRFVLFGHNMITLIISMLYLFIVNYSVCLKSMIRPIRK